MYRCFTENGEVSCGINTGFNPLRPGSTAAKNVTCL
jgi:hypothetical protein